MKMQAGREGGCRRGGREKELAREQVTDAHECCRRRRGVDGRHALSQHPHPSPLLYQPLPIARDRVAHVCPYFVRARLNSVRCWTVHTAANGEATAATATCGPLCAHHLPTCVPAACLRGCVAAWLRGCVAAWLPMLRPLDLVHYDAELAAELHQPRRPKGL